MTGFWYPPDDHEPAAQQPGQGSAHSVSQEQPDHDPADAVRKVAEEITRRPIPRPAPRKMGF